jgi:hypothetical protein
VPVRIFCSGRAVSRGRVGFPRIRVVVGAPIPVQRALPTVTAARSLTEELRLAVAALAPTTAVASDTTRS